MRVAFAIVSQRRKRKEGELLLMPAYVALVLLERIQSVAAQGAL